jgi:hypothetical protein
MPLLQPKKIIMITTFKAFYVRKTFAKCMHVTDGTNKFTVKEFSKSFNTKHQRIRYNIISNCSMHGYGSFNIDDIEYHGQSLGSNFSTYNRL